MSETIPLEGLLQTRAGSLICYPRFDFEEAERRLRELRLLGVEALELRGRHRVNEVPVLGKGHVGVVVAARIGGALAALKIRRIDADRCSLAAEAENLRLANGVSVGPRLLGASANFLLMELIEGAYLADWIEGLGPSEGELRRALRRLIDKARRLDRVGLDHGELSRAQRHVFVTRGDPRIVDFESASTGRRAANVTSIVQYVYINRRMRGLVGRLMPLPELEALLHALRRYRRSSTEEDYRGLLPVCGLG